MQFFWGGEGGERTIERALQNQFGRAQKVGIGLVCARSLKGKRQGMNKGGGGTHHVP